MARDVICPVCGERTSEAVVNLHLDKGCPRKRKGNNDGSGLEWFTAKKLGKSQDAIEVVEATQPQEAETIAQEVVPQPKPDSPVSKPSIGAESALPLAERMRPRALAEIVGQSHLIGDNGILRPMIESGKLPSMILWGPSGVGKTTLARVLARELDASFHELSAPSAGSVDVKRIVTQAKRDFQLLRRSTILFLDEIHRFNRSQQDSLLQAVERGDVTLIGATTENPSFKLTGALLSRMRVFVLQPLSSDDIRKLVDRASPQLDSKSASMLVNAANGDARSAYNMLELLNSFPSSMGEVAISKVLRHSVVYDQRGDFHYDLISALHKSIRGGDADAALYYLARMLEGGEDPLYVSRRMIRIASEDIGIADDSCLPLAIAAHTAVQQIGLPECDMALAHLAVRLARAPKSVEVYKAWKAVRDDVKDDPVASSAPVPLHLRNAPTKLMSDIGYGREYKYNPDYVGEVDQQYLPVELKDRKWLGVFKPSLKDR